MTAGAYLPSGFSSQEIAAIAYQNKAVVYNLLFAAAATLRTIGADPKHLGADIGFFAVLHTWGQNLMHHPHLHCVVPGDGLSPHGERWIGCRPGFFLPVKVLSRFFCRCFLALLKQREAFQQYLLPVRQKEWVVYAKPPFAGPEQVLDYVGRYTAPIGSPSPTAACSTCKTATSPSAGGLRPSQPAKDHDTHGR